MAIGNHIKGGIDISFVSRLSCGVCFRAAPFYTSKYSINSYGTGLSFTGLTSFSVL